MKVMILDKDAIFADINAEKLKLMDLRKTLNNSDLRGEHIIELRDAINLIIGRLNCDLTDNDIELNHLAIKDKIRT